MGNKKHHSMLQGIGEKVKFASELAGAVKTGWDIAKGAYCLPNRITIYSSSRIITLN